MLSGSIWESATSLCMDYSFVANRAMWNICFDVEHLHLDKIRGEQVLKLKI